MSASGAALEPQSRDHVYTVNDTILGFALHRRALRGSTSMKQQFVALAFGLTLISVPAGTAPSSEGAVRCATAFKFEPGPVVNGMHRQPTAGEIEARIQELRWQDKGNTWSCRDAPRGRLVALLSGRVNPALGSSVLMIAELP